MLRPATPLTILLFVAFVLLLLSVISTPIVKAIPLASYNGIDYGVFGACKGNKCTDIRIGYTNALFDTSTDDKNFDLSSSARHSLSSILIVHPIAALLTLVCCILAATSHLHAPSHSPRFLLALLILLFPTLLITLLAFLVDILLFVPHLQWGGWIVLAATILITASGVVTCAMRRTLVSRKARKRRIAENPEMNGENFYSRQNTVRAESPPPLSAQPTAPMVNGAPGADNLPAFATFDAKNRRLSDEDRIPLNSRTPSNRTAPSTRTALNSPDGVGPGSMDNGLDRYDMSGRGAPGGLRGGRGGRAYNGPRDEFGNPLPPSAAFGPMPPGAIRRDPSEPPRIRHQYSNETMSSQGSRGRGMGGYPPRGRSNGRGRPYGPNRGSYGPGRGGSYRPGQGGHGANGSLPMGAMVAGAGAGMMVGEMRDRDPQGPPSDYTNGYQPQGVQGSVMPGPYRRNMSPSPHAGPRGPPSALGYGRQPSPGPPSAPGYGRQPSPGPPSAPGYGRQPSPGPPSAPGYGRQPSPGPPSGSGGYGYAVRQQSPRVPDGQRFRSDSPPPPLPGVFRNETDGIGQAVEMDAFTGSPSQRPTFGANNQLRDSDSDVQGMVGLQQHRGASPLRQDSSAMTPSSVYSNQDSYIPPRAAWAGGPARNRTPPIITTHNAASSRNSPVELPTQQPNLSPRNQQKSPSHARINSADNYYEDVDPRFADPEPLPQSTNQVHSSLMPGHLHDQQQPYSRGTSPSHLNPSSSYDSIQEGARSPAASDGSQFTSVSQRGVNPDWRPPPNQVPGMGMGGVPNRRPVQQQRDVLSQNPDFEIPGLGRGSGRGARGGRIPGMIQGMGGGPPGGSRYPGADM